MSTIHVAPGDLRFCPDCLDVFGSLGDLSKPCQCHRSAAVPLRIRGGDFPTPFEICYYCGTQIITSGSKFSHFACDDCRYDVFDLNQKLDAGGMVTLPVGRHSFMHGAWRHARPFTTQPALRAWGRERLRARWEAEDRPTDEWIDVSTRPPFDRTDRSDLAELALRLQETPPDFFIEILKAANAKASTHRR